MNRQLDVSGKIMNANDFEEDKHVSLKDALKPVISWLRNGCDPLLAADELEIIMNSPRGVK